MVSYATRDYFSGKPNTSMGKPMIFDKQVALEFDVFTQIIVGAFDTLEGVKWTTRHHQEFGFYCKDKINKAEIFLGIWFEGWRHFEIPLVLTVFYDGKSRGSFMDKIKKYISTKGEGSLTFVDYQDHGVILFQADYFKFDDEDYDRVADLFSSLTYFIEWTSKELNK